MYTLLYSDDFLGYNSSDDVLPDSFHAREDAQVKEEDGDLRQHNHTVVNEFLHPKELHMSAF